MKKKLMKNSQSLKEKLFIKQNIMDFKYINYLHIFKIITDE